MRWCVCAKSLQSCPTLCDPMGCSLPGSSAHGWQGPSFSRTAPGMCQAPSWELETLVLLRLCVKRDRQQWTRGRRQRSGNVEGQEAVFKGWSGRTSLRGCCVSKDLEGVRE